MAMRAMRLRKPRLRSTPASFMNLIAANQFGLAAGLDKDASAFPALAALGFGWVEVGTVTPRPQPGNSKPRLFRLERDRALINRMGFNSCGVERFIENLSKKRKYYDTVLGINIGKNAATPMDRAEEDYLYALEHVYPHADYIAVNISSPNTPSLRDLQHVDRLKRMVESLLGRRERLRVQHDRYVPVAVKLSPDLSTTDVQRICNVLSEQAIDGVIATNTTTTRPECLRSDQKEQDGGLSGAPLESLATEVVANLHENLGSRIPIIGVGGVEDADTAEKKLSAGACAVQSYTAFIYQGPRLLNRLLSTV